MKIIPFGHEKSYFALILRARNDVIARSHVNPDKYQDRDDDAISCNIPIMIIHRSIK